MDKGFTIKVDKIGFVRYVGGYGTDLTVVNTARVSMGVEHEIFHPEHDKGLIEYLIRHEHPSPFYHPVVELHVKCPIFVRSQWFRHEIGTAKNEVSRRYMTVDEDDIWYPTIWREGADDIKQGSKETEISDPEGAFLIYDMAVRSALYAYNQLLKFGVAKEQARVVLPQAVFTEFRFTASLWAWMHFFRLRSAPDAQVEIQDYAKAVGEIIGELFPVSWQAFISQKG